MTPLQISILLHYHCCAGDFRDGNFNAPVVREVVDGFRESGFLRLTTDDDKRSSIYLATDKTAAYVNALCDVPAPVQQWVVPSTDGGGV